MALVSDIGLAVLQAREGVRLTAYLDSVGVWTIGWGHTKGVTKGQKITRAQAEAFLREDIDSHAGPVLAAVKVPLADNERDALVSVAFNIGVGGFKRSTFLRRLNAGDRAGCAEAIMMWDTPAEIIPRRRAERDQFLTPYSVAMPKARSTDRARTKTAPRAKEAAPTPVIAPRAPTVPAASVTAPWWSRWFTPRSPAAKARPGLHSNGSADLWDVQAALKERGYYNSGLLDGLDGSKTQAAVAQARKDNGLGDGGVDAQFLAGLPTWPHVRVSQERAQMSISDASAHAPELFTPPKWLISAGLGSLGLGGASGSGLMDQVQGGVAKFNEVSGQVQSAFAVAASVVGFVVEHKTWFFVGIGLLVLWRGISALLRAWILVKQARA